MTRSPSTRKRTAPTTPRPDARILGDVTRVCLRRDEGNSNAASSQLAFHGTNGAKKIYTVRFQSKTATPPLMLHPQRCSLSSKRNIRHVRYSRYDNSNSSDILDMTIVTLRIVYFLSSTERGFVKPDFLISTGSGPLRLNFLIGRYFLDSRRHCTPGGGLRPW